MGLSQTLAPGKVRVVRSGFDASVLVWALAAIVLAFMVLAPLAWLFASSIRDGSGSWTFGNYIAAFTNPLYLGPIGNSLILAVAVASSAVLVATPLAWLVARTNLPHRGLIQALMLATFVTPEFLGAEAWIFLAAPHSGWLNRLWNFSFHVDGPFNIYTLPGAIFVIGLYSVPYTFTFVLGALEMMSSEIEDAAATLGAGAFRTAWHVTLPIAAPAIIAGFIMSFLETLGLFGAPAFLLVPAREQVMTTQLYQFFQFPQRIELAAAYAIPLLVVTLILLGVQRRLLGKRGYVLVSGKGQRRRPIPLGPWRWPIFTLALLPSVLALALPYGALLLTSFMRSWGNGLRLDNLTWHWYAWALHDNAGARDAMIHSLVYGAGAATIAVAITSLIAYAVVRRLVRGVALLGFLCMAPVVVPGIVLAIGFFAAYSHPPVVLYGTAGMLIVAFATRFLPIAYSNFISLFNGVHPELENAARTLGASRLRTLAVITVPILRSGFIASWLLVFVPAIRELSAAVFLFTPKTAVMSTMIYDYTDAGNFESVSTLGVLMLVITLVIVALARRLSAGTAIERSRTM